MMSDKHKLSGITVRLAVVVGLSFLVITQFLSTGLAAVKIGLVLQAKGDIFPPIKQYSQLVSQRSFDLADGAFIELAIYADCKIIQINGPGILNIQDELLWSGSKPKEKTNNNCVKPMVYTNSDMEKGGINLRGENAIAAQSRLQLHETLPISSNPIIVFDGFNKLVNHELIITGNGDQFRVQLDSPVMHWPDNIVSLVPELNYQFQLAKGRRILGENYKSRVAKPDVTSDDHLGYLIIRLQ